jgi:hypothetical protein
VLRALTVERAVWVELTERATEPRNTRQLQALLRAGQRNTVVRDSKDPLTVSRMFLGTLLTMVVPNGLIQSSQAPAVPDRRAMATFIDHLMDLISDRRNS